MATMNEKPRGKIAKLREKAARGDGKAMCRLGMIYAKGIGVMQSHIKAFYWLCRGITAEYDKSCFGIPDSCEAAVNWLQAAAESGHAGAQYAFGTLMESRVDVVDAEDEPDLYEGLGARDEEANRYEEGITCIAVSIQPGILGGTVKDAVAWYRKAAKQGHLNAQLRLGKIHAEGWSWKAGLLADRVGAKEIHATGGYGYWDVADEKEAIRWYRMAAAQGSKDAREALSCLVPPINPWNPGNHAEISQIRRS